MEEEMIFDSQNQEIPIPIYYENKMSIIYYLYDKDDSNLFVRTEKYFNHNVSWDLPHTFVALPNNFNIENQVASFHEAQNKWTVTDKEIEGKFFKKATGKEFDKIAIKDADLYTQCVPTIEKRQGDEIEFVDNEWRYKVIGQETALIDAKKRKLEMFEEQYNASKSITIKQHDTDVLYISNRTLFLEKIEFAKRNDKEQSTLMTYIDTTANKEFKALLYFWHKALVQYFIFSKDNLEFYLPEYNKCQFITAQIQVEKSNSIADLNVIQLHLVKPNGIEIDVQQDAELMLSDSNTPDQVKTLLEDRKNQDGYYILFNDV